MRRPKLWLVLACLCLVPGTLNAAGVIAQTGFNDAAGINADPAADSPYTIGGTIDARGAGESGWASPWATSIGGVYNGASIASVQNRDTVEGDGALYLRRDTGTGFQGWAYRQWSAPQIGTFRIEQYVKLPAGGNFISRPFGAGVPGGIGPNWQIVNDHFEVKDGNDPGQPYEDTGIAALPDTWYKVSLFVDVPRQRYDFYVNDVRYAAPDFLGFEGAPSEIDHIDYLTSTNAYIDALRILPTPEPASLSLPLLAAPAALHRRRRVRSR